MSALVSTFERTTFDGTRVCVEMVDARAGAWIPQGEYLGSSSARVLSLFMSEVFITDAADLPALLADCRRAQGIPLALSTLRLNRARRAEAKARNAGRINRRSVEHSPRSLSAPRNCRCLGCTNPTAYYAQGWRS